MNERCLVATLKYGPYGVAMGELAEDLLRHYASRCGADYTAETNFQEDGFASAMLRKLAFLRTALLAYDRVLWIDLDILVRPDAPDLFAIVPADRLAMVDECATLNDHEVWLRHQHMIETCQQEGLPIPESQGRYFNCGLQMIPASAQWLFAPRRNPVSHSWCEQSLVNVRLFTRPETPLYVLPECCNRFVYWPGLVPRRQAGMSWFLHFAGPPDYATRLRDMQVQRDTWRCVYPDFPWKENDRG